MDLDTTGLTGSDYQWVDASGTALTYNPKNVGTYYIKLSDTAFAKLQAQNPNFQLTSNDGLGVYTITPTTANITFGGTNLVFITAKVLLLLKLTVMVKLKFTLLSLAQFQMPLIRLKIVIITWLIRLGLVMMVLK